MEKKPPKVHLFNATLHGMEELGHFKTPEDRQRALEEVGSEVRARDLAVGITLCAIAAFGSFVLARMLFQHVLPRSIPAWVAENSCYVAGAMGMFLTLRFLHRWGTAAELRKKLVATGVPVCIGCGYKLAGLPVSAENCPECGSHLDAKVLELVRQSNITGGKGTSEQSPIP